MANNIKLIVYPTKDVNTTKKLLNAYLDTEPYVDGEWYVGYKVGDMEVGIDPNGTAVIAYTDTDDINASLETLKAVGARVVMEPKDVGGGLMVAQVELDGAVLGLRQPVQR
jgi:predicted enzyme related to lactoylglutathione lyase